MLADMPFVSAGMLGELIDRYRATGARLVVSTYGDVPAPPILYRRDLFGELGDSLDGDGCGKRVVKQHRAHAVEIRWPSSALIDLDSPDDWQGVRYGHFDPLTPQGPGPKVLLTEGGGE
jgi:molybdenum cofactor cytidylyltransferase